MSSAPKNPILVGRRKVLGRRRLEHRVVVGDGGAGSLKCAIGERDTALSVLLATLRSCTV